MFRAQPRSELSKFINAYKSASSRLLKKEYPQIKEKLWKEADSLALANVQRNLEGAFRKFFREPKVGFPNYKSKKFPEILYNKYDKWKYLPAGKVSETAKDHTHKNKTSSFDTGVLRKSLPGNRENFPDAKRAAGTTRNRRRGLHYVMKG